MSDAYDLVVIGAGSGGVRAARMAANYGARVAIIEEYRVGGTCVIRGCVPKKLFVYASRFADQFETAESFGWKVDATFDWPTLVANKDKEIDRLEKAYVSGLEKPGVEIIRERAVVTGPHSVQLKSGRTLETRYILVATGGKPSIPQIEGADLGISSNEAFYLKALPHSILIEGGGYIAMEFATIFAGLGVKTTVVYRGERVLRGFDEDLRVGVEAGMQARGVTFIYNCTIAKLSRQGQGDVNVTFSSGVDAPYGGVMFATGRSPNVGGLGLEQVGVKLTSHGAIDVDAYSKTSVDSIYAVGDVTGRAALTPVAIREGWGVAETLFNNNPTAVDHSQIGTAVFAEPEAASIGQTEAQAAITHPEVEVYVARFRPMINTLSLKSERMMLKLIIAGKGGKVVGCHILGPDAAELIQLVAIPMGMGATMADFTRVMAMHPTAAEELVTFKAPSYVYRDGVKV
jgi:glutathione reductase (NADPH)